MTLIKRKTAYEQVQSDKTLRLTEEQKREVSNNLRKEEETLKDAVKRCYRLAYAPSKDGLEEVDLGIPTYEEKKALDQEVFGQLKAEQEILEKISPSLVKEKYLRDKEFVGLRQIYDSMLRTPEERRITSPEAFESISQGVKQGSLRHRRANGRRSFCYLQILQGRCQGGIRQDRSNREGEHLLAAKAIRGRDANAIPPGKGDSKGGTAIAVPSQPTPARALGHVTLEFEVPRGKSLSVNGDDEFLAE